VIKVTFHEPSHRRLAARYWSFWLSQQQNPKTARALDIGKHIILAKQEFFLRPRGGGAKVKKSSVERDRDYRRPNTDMVVPL
jgi:hypothetical protein